MKKLSNKWGNVAAIVLLAIYIFVGLSVYGDYGISTDELIERLSAYTNIKYVVSLFDEEKAEKIQAPDLMTYKDRYYGLLLQMPTIVIERAVDSLRDNVREILYMRHIYTFFVCIAGYVAFFFLCKKLFNSSWWGILGAGMVAFYPQFFAQQFYNIKDMIFASMFMVAMLATVLLIEHKFKWPWLVLFTICIAVATNVRIVGIVFLILIIGYILADFLFGKFAGDSYEATCTHPIRAGLFIFVGFFVILAITMPITWHDPVGELYNTFVKFCDYDDWFSNMVFMGGIFKKEDFPWYYIPMWLFITLPVWYLVLLLISSVKGIAGLVRIGKKKTWPEILTKYKYIVFCTCLVSIPWIGIQVNQSSVYNGWRHFFFCLPPLVLFMLYGLRSLLGNIALIKKTVLKRISAIALAGLVIVGFGWQMIWMVINHPYEMVYFNNIGKHFAQDFDRDYWHLSCIHAFRYVKELEGDNKFSIDSDDADRYQNLLTEEEKAQIIIEDVPKYYIETFRGVRGNEVDMPGYEEIYHIDVDGFKIASIFRRCD